VKKPSNGKVIYLTLDQLVIVDGFNVRENMGDLKALAGSIMENGVKLPLQGYKLKDKNEAGDDVYAITNGHRRYAALESINDPAIFIPFIVEPRGYKEEDRTFDLLTLNDGKPLGMLEEAEAFRRLMDFGWKEKDIAKKIGKSATHVVNCMLLMTATDKVKKLVNDDKVSATLVVEMLKKADPKEVEKDLIAGAKVAKEEYTEKTEKVKTPSAKARAPKKEKVTAKHVKKAGSKNEAAAPAKAEKKQAAPADKISTEKLERLHEALSGYDEGVQIPEAFEVLEALIKWGKGQIETAELGGYFFEPEGETTTDE